MRTVRHVIAEGFLMGNFIDNGLVRNRRNAFEKLSIELKDKFRETVRK